MLAALQATRLAGRAQMAQQSSLSRALAACLGSPRARPAEPSLLSRFFADGFGVELGQFIVPGGTEYKIMIYYSGGGHDLEFGTVI